MMVTTSRICNELRDLQKNHLITFGAGPVDDDIFHWKATILGPADSPFAGGAFRVYIHLPSDYPFSPPMVSFYTKIYHPNITNSRLVCPESLQEQWTPGLTILEVLYSISYMLKNPNLDYPMEPEIACLYMTDRATYEKNARIWTRHFAMD